MAEPALVMIAGQILYLTEGELVPNYRLTGLLGQGGFGEVWSANGLGGFPAAFVLACGSLLRCLQSAAGVTFAEPILALSLTPVGRGLLTGGRDGQVAWWDTLTGQRLDLVTAHGSYVLASTIAPDGRTMITGSADCLLQFWRVPSIEAMLDTNACMSTLHRVERMAPPAKLGRPPRFCPHRTGAGHADCIFSVAVSTDGHLVLSASGDGVIHLWNLEVAADESARSP